VDSRYRFHFLILTFSFFFKYRQKEAAVAGVMTVVIHSDGFHYDKWQEKNI